MLKNKKSKKKKKKKSQLILQIYILFQQHFRHASSVHFQALMVKKLRYMYYNEQITYCDNAHDQKEGRSNGYH